MKNEGFIDFKGYKTWYSTFGDLKSGVTPLFTLHGGPGYTHHHLQNLSQLADRGIPVILYDQLGCGNSDRPDQPDLWTIQLFIEEINALRAALNLDTISLLGHSWGGSLAVEYLFTKPRGVQKLILSSPLLDTQLWIEENNKLKDPLPLEISSTMRKHEDAGTTDTEEYQAANKIFNKTFGCRLDPQPADIQKADEESSQQVYETMWGPSESHATGTLKNWTALDRLNQIDIPTLLLSGKYDEATPKQMQVAQNLLPNATWTLFQNSSHVSNYEEPKKYLDAVSNFLDIA
jgi:proline-specific peptidase